MELCNQWKEVEEVEDILKNCSIAEIRRSDKVEGILSIVMEFCVKQGSQTYADSVCVSSSDWLLIHLPHNVL